MGEQKLNKKVKGKKIIWGEDTSFFGPRSWFRNSLILKSVLKYKKGGKVLDFGCGTGDLLSRIHSSGFTCVGIDGSPLVIKYLHNKFKNKNVKIRAVLGNENFLYSTNNRFDVVVSGETLEHLKNDVKAVRGFHKVLNPGGICVISVPAHPERWTKIDKYAGHFRRYKKEALAEMFKAEKFKILDIFYWGFPLGYIWEKLIFRSIFLRRFRKKKYVKHSKDYANLLLKHEWFKVCLSNFFWFDQLFNFSEKGIGLILVAKKVNS